MVSSTLVPSPVPAGNAVPGRNPFQCISGIPSGWWHRCTGVPLWPAWVSGCSPHPWNLPSPGPHHRVQFIDEHDDLAAESDTIFRTFFNRSSNSPLYLAPATRDARSRAYRVLFFRDSGTSPATIRRARPSTMAVLPTPGSPISTGLFFFRRDRISMVRRISSSRRLPDPASRPGLSGSGPGRISPGSCGFRPHPHCFHTCR